MTPKTAKKPRPKRSLLQGKEGLRFAVMLILVMVLGAVFTGVLDNMFKSKASSDEKPIDSAPISVILPPIDRKLLEQVKDDNAVQRLSAEAEPYTHLLEMASYIAPGVLPAMGLSDSPITVDQVRANPDKYRGRPVAFEGEVIDLSPAVPIPGMERFKRTEGMLETARNQRVFFAVIKEVPGDITEGGFARVEGFFFKLRDFKFPEKLDMVPHVVGLELRHSFGEFEPVKELDPALLATIDDARRRPGKIPTKPLYHLASWVKNRAKTGEWRQGLPELGYEDVQNILAANDKVPRGKVFRVLGALYDLQTKLAEPNPLGIRYWTRAWVKHRHAETVQINIPGQVGGQWNTGDFVVFYGAFFKRHWYESGIDPRDPTRRLEKIVPLFVADELYRWELVDNPANLWIKATLTGITLLLIALVCLLVIRDNRADQEVRQRILERRKRRRGR